MEDKREHIYPFDNCIDSEAGVYLLFYDVCEAHYRIVFEEMSSWTALLWHLGMKTVFYSKYIKTKYFRTFILKI